MLQVYLKQAWQLLKQNKLYSTIYIIGTGLAIAVTMTIAIAYYIKIAPVYPETNRNRMLVATSMSVKNTKDTNMSSSAFSYQYVKDHLYTLNTPEAVTAELQLWDDYPLVELSEGKGMLPVNVKYVDDKFWKVFNFVFMSGMPFTESDFQSGIKTAVISASLANTLFGTAQAEGKRISLDGNEFRISGVVRDASFATPITYAQIWVPFTVKPDQIIPTQWAEGLLGSMRVYILARSASDMDAVTAEAEAVVKKINSSQERYIADMSGQPEAYWKSVFRNYNNHEIDWGEVCKDFGVLLLALLIVPAVNLAGMVSSRMEKRLPEMGIRKSFGASRGILIGQILTENLLLTVLGGLWGLVFSYFLVFMSRNWILTLFDRWPGAVPEGTDLFFTSDMLFNPIVFLITFGICFVLNFLSAIIPAYYGLKKGIIYSLSSNK